MAVMKVMKWLISESMAISHLSILMKIYRPIESAKAEWKMTISLSSVMTSISQPMYQPADNGYIISRIIKQWKKAIIDNDIIQWNASQKPANGWKQSAEKHPSQHSVSNHLVAWSNISIAERWKHEQRRKKWRRKMKWKSVWRRINESIKAIISVMAAKYMAHGKSGGSSSAARKVKAKWRRKAASKKEKKQSSETRRNVKKKRKKNKRISGVSGEIKQSSAKKKKIKISKKANDQPAGNNSEIGESGETNMAA